MRLTEGYLLTPNVGFGPPTLSVGYALIAELGFLFDSYCCLPLLDTSLNYHRRLWRFLSNTPPPPAPPLALCLVELGHLPSMSANTSPQVTEHKGPQLVKVFHTETGTRFKWVIEKFSLLDANKVYSEEFFAYGQIWRLLIFPKGDGKVDYLSLYLEAVLPRVLVNGWSRYQEFSISVISQLESTDTKKIDAKQHFTAHQPAWGFASFMLLSELTDPAKGFLVNDACIVEAKFRLNTENMKIRLKLLVDKKHNRVVFAECDTDFVDILLSFLTMPLGRVQKLLGENSSIGCISNLYDSVENIEHQYFKTDACKSMLLNPLSEADRYCGNLTVNLNSFNPYNCIYTCSSQDCCSKSTCYYSYVPNVNCTCAKRLSRHLELSKLSSEEVFVKKELMFIVTDDLHIMPASTSVILSILAKIGNDDQSLLEERIVDVGYEEVLNLLHDALSLKSPLTKLCYGSSANDAPNSSDADDMYIRMPKTEFCEESKNTEVKVNLLLTKNGNKVVHMDGNEEMANLMFSFLTLPLGSIVKLLNKSTSLGCIDNIYSSAESLCSQGAEYMKSEDSKMMLLNPKLAPFFSCTNQILSIDEAACFEEHTKSGCYHCYYSEKTNCTHVVKFATLKGLNPKSLNKDLEKGGGYAKGTYKFVVTNDLRLCHFSPVSIVGIVNKLKVPFSDLVEKQITISELEALNLLKAALVSKSALDDAFTLNYVKKRRN